MTILDYVKKNNEEIIYVKNHKISEGVLPLLHFNKLDGTGIVEGCFTSRAGGVSQGIFSSLNLSFTRGDDENAVLTNYKRLAEALGLSISDFVCSDQTHTTNVLRVGKSEAGYGITRDKPYRDVDGLITNDPGLVLSTFYADCVPLYIVDPVNKAIGLSHSGWRGTVGRMGQVTLEAMAAEFGTRADEVVVAVGPSICQDCYEISEDVAFEFIKEFDGYKEEILIDKNNGKYQLDLWKCNEIVFKEAGVRADNIALTNICTCCNSNLLFSHRASHGKRGNLGAFLYIKP